DGQGSPYRVRDRENYRARVCASAPGARCGQSCWRESRAKSGRTWFSLQSCMSPTHWGNRRGTRGRVPDREVTLVSPAKGLVGFSQSLFLCDADVLERVKVVALGNLA